MTKSGLPKIYFTELPKEVQERFHYDPQQAAAAQAAAAQQTEAINRQAAELDKHQKEAYKQQRARSAKQQTKVTSIQALADRLADLEQQEVSLLAAIGRARRTHRQLRDESGLMVKVISNTPIRQKQIFLFFEAA